MATRNIFLANLPKSVVILGNARIVVEKAAEKDIDELGNLPKAGLNKLAALSGLPVNHHAAIAAKAAAAMVSLEADPRVNAAMTSEITMESGDNALLIKHYRAAMLVLAAAKRCSPNVSECITAIAKAG